MHKVAEHTIQIRRATAADEGFLWTMLYHAAQMSGDVAQALEQAQADPVLQHYVARWGQQGDLGVIAESESGLGVGAAWLRLELSGIWQKQGYHEIYDEGEEMAGLPELAIAVMPDYRNQNIGARLLQQLIENARGTYPAILLNVRDTNPACRLYERIGFAKVGKLTNRVGGMSLIMRYTL